MPLNWAKLPSAWRKKRSIGIMRSMALFIACGGCRWRAENNCRSGKRSASSSISTPGLRLMWPPSGRICRVQFLAQPPRVAAQLARLALDAERGAGQRHHRLQPRKAVARLVQGLAQVAHLPRQAADEAAVEARVGVLQHEGRLAQPADDAARQDVGPPAERMPAALQVDPLVDQRARVGAGDGGIGGAQMAQPGEARASPPPIRRKAA